MINIVSVLHNLYGFFTDGDGLVFLLRLTPVVKNFDTKLHKRISFEQVGGRVSGVHQVRPKLTPGCV